VTGDLWNGVELERRRRVVLAVRRGETLPDAEDAALAVRYATALRRSGRSSTWLAPTPAAASVVVILLFWLAVHLLTAPSWHRPAGVAASVALVCVAVLDAFTRLSLLRRVDTSARANAALLHAFGRPVSEDRESLPWNPPALGAALIPVVTTLVLLIAIVVLTGDETSPPHWQLLLFALAGAIGAATGLVGVRMGLAGRRLADAGARGRRAATVGTVAAATLGVFWVLEVAVVLAWNW